MISSIRSPASPAGPVEAFSTGRAVPAISAPRAIVFAASSPLLIPPLAIILMPLPIPETISRLSVVGIPQSKKLFAIFFSTGFFERLLSIFIHEVPPAPPISIPATPASASKTAASADIPKPTSLTITGNGALLQISPIFSARCEKS